MVLNITFLGKGGTGKTTVAIATAKLFASQGQRVLLASQDPSPALGVILGTTVGPDPQMISPNLTTVQLQTTVLLERAWEELKKFEAQYVKTPFFKKVFGQELGILPGMDSLGAINAIRQYENDGNYDVIVYDAAHSQETLRMLGGAEILSWYIRRFSQVFGESELGKNLAPFVQPVTSVVLNVDWSSDNFTQPRNQFDQLLEQAKTAIADPKRVAGYLVTTPDPVAIATARYLWGSSQQVGLTIAGVIVNQSDSSTSLESEFTPLQVSAVPTWRDQNWESLIAALPDFSKTEQAPKPITINLAEREVILFLPTFDKKQVKLTQYGPELTVEAGDQRRNISLPASLMGQQIKGAKFQNSYLIISL